LLSDEGRRRFLLFLPFGRDVVAERPGVGGDAVAVRIEFEDSRHDRIEESAVVGDDQNRALVLTEESFEPGQRVDVEVIRRLVENQDIRPGGQ
jgi:hypothetical protein